MDPPTSSVLMHTQELRSAWRGEGGPTIPPRNTSTVHTSAGGKTGKSSEIAARLPPDVSAPMVLYRPRRR